jgi:ATP-binding cassette subfamily F protein 3
MSILTAHNLAKSYGADDIFEGISLEIPYKARIAFVGPNGAGKTTLLNILIGADMPTEGTVSLAKNTRIGFLPQRPELVGNHTLWEEQLRAFENLRHMERELARLEQAMADPATHEQALAQYGPLQHEFEHLGGYDYENRIRFVLHGVGFEREDYDTPLSKLSGGQKTRALLARLLLDSPDLLIMDEPTNHLDIQAVEWLEHFLKDFPGAVLAVSHDRYFMDNFASNIWELDFGQLEVYRGNYSHYVRQREERRERLLKEYEAQQEFITKEQDYIRKHMGSRWTAQAKGRLKKLETMRKRGKIIDKPRNRREIHLQMKAGMRSGDLVLRTRALAVGYPDDNVPLFYSPNITLLRGETAALIGPNGVGKSTFLKTIIGQLEPLSGEVIVGASVKIGYFAQAHELLDPKKSILDEVLSVKSMPISEARHYLGSFLFSGDDVFRQVETLSGGERGRVALAKLALSGANLLLLDEPTNHLDIESQEILQEVLNNYDGTILLVSHDRYLINALATQIWAAEPGALTVFEGSYEEYVGMKNTLTPDPSPLGRGEKDGRTVNPAPVRTRTGEDTSNGGKKHGLNPYQLQKRVAEVEAQIHALEARLDDLTSAIDEASAQGDHEHVRELGEQYTQTEADLQRAMEEWEMLVE